jgi:glycosyltransferase involved in cell wall biosynthesis
MATPRFFPMMGGVENHVYQVARRLSALGSQVTVLTADPRNHWPTNETLEGIDIRRVRAWPARKDYYFAPGIYSFLQSGEWDILHVQSYHTFFAPLAMIAAQHASLPYVVTFHGGGHSSILRNKLRGIHRRLLRPFFARAARLVATARFELDLFGKQLHIPEEKFIIIPNGGDLVIGESPSRSSVTDSTLIASLGRLEQYKGHHRILAALPLILELQPNARLWIAGEGPFEPYLQRLAGELGVSERVEIRAIPTAQREQMAAELSKARLVTLLSEYETHPMSALEALALGCPVLVADTSGLSELAAMGLARAIPLDSSPSQVAAAVLDQLRDPLIPQTVNLPTWDACAISLLELYESIVLKRFIRRRKSHADH